MSQVVHCKRQQADVYVGRGSPYGNPFPLSASQDRQQAIAAFREWVAKQPELLRLIRRELPGKTLGCFCAPQPCHGDVLAKIASGAWDAWIPAEPIFVFGSNLQGRHGKGAAREARLWYDAQPGAGDGPTGQSYALPTKDAHLAPLPLQEILGHIEAFLSHARQHPETFFRVTRIGCGLAGHGNQEALIREAFLAAPGNVLLPGTWEALRQPGLTRLIVAGSRTFTDYDRMAHKLDHLLQHRRNIEIVSGGARGADLLGERYAVERGMALRRMPADWNRQDKAAGHIRNQRMSWYGTHLAAFWDGQSRGTAGMIELATQDQLGVRRIAA